MADKDTIASSTTATKADAPVNGVLDKFIPQISHNAQTASRDSKSWEIVFKGPIIKWRDFEEKLADYQSRKDGESAITGFVNDTASLIQWDTSVYGGSNNTEIDKIIFPYTPGHKFSWKIREYRMEQCDAGLHCIVTVSWEAVFSTTSLEEEEEEPLNEYWTCQLQPTQVSVLAYCKDDPDGDATGSDGTARSWRIKQWDSVDNNENAVKQQFKFNSGVGIMELSELNGHEIEIAKLYAAGINPQFHYPVLQHNCEYQGSGVLKLDDIDTIIDGVPKNCPWKLPSNWKWLKTGYTANYNAVSKTTTITEEWTGAEEWTEEFYSSDAQKRWKIGDR